MTDPQTAPAHDDLARFEPRTGQAGDRTEVFAALAHLVVSVEPAVVLISLARQCVPVFSDSCSIDIVEGEHAYRVTYPPTASPRHDARSPVGGHELHTPLRSLDDPGRGVHFGGDPKYAAFSGEVVHRWDSHVPTAADAAIAELAVELAVSTVACERLAETASRAVRTAEHMRTALMSSRQIGTALGILMATYAITDDAAFELLRTTSQQSQRKLRDLAADVVRTGWLGPA